jgi:hypothetical protein
LPVSGEKAELVKRLENVTRIDTTAKSNLSQVNFYRRGL